MRCQGAAAAAYAAHQSFKLKGLHTGEVDSALKMVGTPIVRILERTRSDTEK